jgi:hypothetical protein
MVFQYSNSGNDTVYILGEFWNIETIHVLSISLAEPS